MRYVKCAWIVLCVLLSLGAGALWFDSRGTMSALRYYPPRTDLNEWRIVWGAGKVGVQWMRPGGGSRGWKRYYRSATYPGEADAVMRSARYNFGGFGCDLGPYSVQVWGDVVLPLWFVMLAFGAYPTWRAYRWWKPSRRARSARGAFEPVVEAVRRPLPLCDFLAVKAKP